VIPCTDEKWFCEVVVAAAAPTIVNTSSSQAIASFLAVLHRWKVNCAAYSWGLLPSWSLSLLLLLSSLFPLLPPSGVGGEVTIFDDDDEGSGGSWV
jgi:hypothetical protein